MHHMQLAVTVPPMSAEGTFDFCASFSGSCSVSGPGGEHILATVQLFSEPMTGTLTGAALMTGNAQHELEVFKGHYMCRVILKPLVERYEPPRRVSAHESDNESAISASLDGGVGAQNGETVKDGVEESGKVGPINGGANGAAAVAAS
jgi:hypothetical protein